VAYENDIITGGRGLHTRIQMKKIFTPGALGVVLCLGVSLARGAVVQPLPPAGQRPFQVDRIPPYYIEKAPKIAQPLNSIRVEVRYRKDYGYKYDPGVVAGAGGPTSCPAFAVLARPSKPVRQEKPTPIATDPRMSDGGGYYHCYFLVSELPRNVPILVRAGMSNARQMPTEAWKGGNQAQPPPGQQRVIANDTRNVILSDGEPRAYLVFEMVYGPSLQTKR
jgi:hypothetical protein